MQDPRFIENNFSSTERKTTITSDATGSYAHTILPHEQFVLVDTTLGVATIRLPDVSEAKGKLYTIVALVGNTNAVTMAEYSTNNSHDFPSAPSLNAADDRVLYFSDGYQWWIVTDQYT